MGKTEQPNKAKREKYFPLLKKLIEEYGEWEVNCLALSKEWGVPESTVNRWKHQILEELGPLDINSFGRNIELAGISNLKLCQRLIRKADSIKDKTAAVRAWNDTVKGYTEFLEAYGYKEKVAAQIELANKPYWEDIADTVQEIENGRNSKKLDKKKGSTKIKSAVVSKQ